MLLVYTFKEVVNETENLASVLHLVKSADALRHAVADFWLWQAPTAQRALQLVVFALDFDQFGIIHAVWA